MSRRRKDVTERTRILDALKRLGEGTIDDIASATGLTRQRVAARLGRLGADQVWPNGKTRTLHTGWPGRVWTIGAPTPAVELVG